MLLRTEILHDFDTFSPSPQVSFKKKKKRLRLPAISNFAFRGSATALEDLGLCSGRLRSPRHSPLPLRPPVADFWFPLSGGVRPCETEHEASFPLQGPKHISVPRAVRERERAVEFAVTIPGGAARLLGDPPPSGRIGLRINASRQRSALAGLLGRARRVVARVCLCAPPANALSVFRMPRSPEPIQNAAVAEVKQDRKRFPAFRAWAVLLSGTE